MSFPLEKAENRPPTKFQYLADQVSRFDFLSILTTQTSTDLSHNALPKYYCILQSSIRLGVDLTPYGFYCQSHYRR